MSSHNRMVRNMALAAILGFGATGAAVAQQQPAQQQAPQAKDFDKAELESFVEAQAEVSDISQDYQQKMQNADNPEAQASMRQEANQEMVQAVNDAGLDPSTYNAIAQAAQSDPQLAQKIEGMR
ncbi:DUF4168 domain-containing protein [Spectribacter hydrogenoxidans]|uniref:DUF4168 domain-containing protein n=1 Tax=Spectribacter hydrogenoxidans TaxID=3075608 RepID=A0ABU3BXY2_9GAMM|nr:DUF4168 domain-containing protein [Salinisphaera sp. W335]MDT0633994.1 DUF4168 domain-containing protein [Salinisphaera sp. W335]